MALPQKFNSWKYTSKIIRQIHNQDVVQHFKDVKPDDDLSRSRSGLKAGLIVRAKDSALEILNKQIIFRLAIQNKSFDAIATIPESYNLRPGDFIPQLVVVYRSIEKKRSGNYSLTIPHFTGTKSINLPQYTKGNHQATLILKDGSKILVNAVNKAAGLSLIKACLKYVDRRFITDDYHHAERNDITNHTVKPLRGDYYPVGRKNSEPEWRHYF